VTNRGASKPMSRSSLFNTKNKNCSNREVREIVGKRTLTLKIGFVYHVMNSTYIHLRTGGPNIYMYMKGKIYKEPPKGIQ
jgi:hypothetical protein